MENMKNITKNYRPFFHFSTPKGWCNDPNGFSFYKGKVHLFYQYNPFDTKWGPMHWGHATSKNMLKWKNKKIALFPDKTYDNGGCFSGSAIEHDGKHYLIYTGIQKITDKDSLQQQCLAFGNGRKYSKFQKNPVITAENIPFDFDITNFRDPKVFQINGYYFLICMLQQKNGKSALAILRSENLQNWQFLNIIDKCTENISRLWECPDFFTLNNKDIILISAKDMTENPELNFFNGDNNLYITGTLDSLFNFQRDTRPENNFTAAQIDYGIDFYAQQTCLLPDQRRILIAWMQNWESPITPSHYKWTGMMTLPREISLYKDRLIQKPIREFEKLKKSLLQGKLSNCEFKLIQEESKRTFELILEIPHEYIYSKGISEITLNISSNDKEYVTLSIELCKMKITFDRSHTKYGGQTPKRTVILPPLLPLETDDLYVHIIGDYNSLETYLNKGEFWFTNAYFMDSPESRISLESSLQCNVNFSFYEL